MTLTPDEREAAIEKMARAIDPKAWSRFEEFCQQSGFTPGRVALLRARSAPIQRSIAMAAAALDAVLPLIERAANRAAFEAMSLLTAIDFDRFTEHDEALLERVLFDVKAALADEVRT